MMISSVLKSRGHQVDIFDGNFQSLEELDKKLKGSSYAFVGLSGLITTFLYQKRAAGVIRQSSPDSRIVSGGGLASAVDSELLEVMPELDVAVIGEGENTAPELFEKIDSKLNEILGIAYRQGGKIIRNPNRELIGDLDSLPKPDLHSWNLENYFANGSFPLSPTVASANRRGNILTSRGCPFKCDFCFNSLGRNRVRFRSSERIMEELQDLVGNYNIDFLSFMDEEFLANKKLVYKITEKMRERDWRFKWGIAARSTSVDKEILRQIKSAGCDFIYFGFDSGSESTLKRMNKKMTLDDNFEAFRMSVEAGIYPVPNIIIGYDNETLGNIEENYQFFQRLIDFGKALKCEKDREVFQRGFNNFGAIYFATPYPGSELYKRNRANLPSMKEILERVSFKDAYELTVNVSQIPDERLIYEKNKMENFVRNFKL
jgi:radical SAM superfamily enzyme YgiQ (UPF0313 family)